MRRAEQEAGAILRRQPGQGSAQSFTFGKLIFKRGRYQARFASERDQEVKRFPANQPTTTQNRQPLMIGDTEEPAPPLIIVALCHKRRCPFTRGAPGVVKGILQQIIRLLHITNKVQQKGMQRVLMAVYYRSKC
jgi:hypothetical protein